MPEVKNESKPNYDELQYLNLIRNIIETGTEFR